MNIYVEICDKRGTRVNLFRKRASSGASDGESVHERGCPRRCDEGVGGSGVDSSHLPSEEIGSKVITTWSNVAQACKPF